MNSMKNWRIKLAKPTLEDFQNQLMYRLGMYEHLVMTQELLTQYPDTRINTVSAKSMVNTNNDLLLFVSQEIMGICQAMIRLFSIAELGELHLLILDTIQDMYHNSPMSTAIHQTDGKVH